MIFERQYKNLLAQELLRYLLEGRLPSVNEIANRLLSALGKDGKVTYQYIGQPSNSQFQVPIYNKSLKRIKFDIDIFQEELLDLFKDLNKRISYADLFYKTNNYQLKKLKSELLSLLFSMSNTDFYFLNAYDNFTDSSKLDINSSTDGIINLSERCIQIPSIKTEIKRVNTGHLYKYDDWPVTLVRPLAVISAQTVVGTSFSNMFRDNINSWVYEVKSNTKEPVEIKFKFPIGGEASSEAEIFVNRIELIPAIGNQKVKVRVSTDDVNYLPISGYEDYVKLESSDTVYALDFETNLVQYIEVSILKESLDEEISLNGSKVSQYLFGLKSISLFTTGRGTSGRYQSKPFVFDNSEGIISTISLQADHFIPSGTNILYYVGVDKGEDTIFLPINPVGLSTKNGVPETIVLNGVSKYNKKFSSDLSGAGASTQYGSPFQGKTFYRIGPSLNPKPVFGSVSLFRGYKHWYRDKSSRFENIDIIDTYVSFNISDIEGIYSTYQEAVSFSNRTTNGLRSSILTTSKFPYYDSTKGHQLKPPTGVDPLKDPTPNYSIYKVIYNTDSVRQTKTLVLGNSLTQNLPTTAFIMQSVDPAQTPILATSTGVTYVLGVDYEFETEEIGGISKPTGRFIIPEGSAFLNSQGQIAVPNLLLRFTYTTDPDITHKVVKIQDNFITLNNCVVAPSDNVTVLYRFIPKGNDEIVHASIRVSDQPSKVSTRKFYTEGVDYSIDSNSGLIQRIPSGSIPPGNFVYIDFRYRNSIPGVNTFTTWVYVSNENGVRINFELDPTSKKNKLIVDFEKGEALYINGPGGIIDITRAIVTPSIGPGWVQIVCRSKDPDSNVLFRTNLIDQVIQLKDSYKKRIFKEGGSYFSNIVAFREPMIQKTLNHLRVNTLRSNHEFFAIDDFTDPERNYIVVNYNPNTTEELYNRIPSADEDLDDRPEQIGEIYYVEWNSKNNDDQNIDNDIVVRIDLQRNPSIDEGLTPKVFSYQVRAST